MKINSDVNKNGESRQKKESPGYPQCGGQEFVKRFFALENSILGAQASSKSPFSKSPFSLSSAFGEISWT